AVRAALQDELAARGREILELSSVYPHIEWQHRREASHDLVRRPALALLVHDVGLQEHATSHGQRWHRLGAERALRILIERDGIALGHALKEGTVARRALRVQPKVRHCPLP